MLTNILIELLRTKMGECNEIRMSNIKLMMHIKATMSFLKRIKKSGVYDIINLNHTKMHLFISCLM